MKKLVLALSAVAAFTGSALAADLPARTYTKAPMMAPVYNWTGFYIFGGGGYGMFDSNTFVTTFPAGTPLTIGQKVGFDAGEQRNWCRWRDNPFVPSQWLVRWRRRGELPEYLRHRGSRLVHEDR